MSFAPYRQPARLRRNAVIVGCVLAAHAAVLWVLHRGLARHAQEIVVPVAMLTEFIEPPQPKPAPQPAPVAQPVQKTKVPARPPAPQPLVIAAPEPAPNAPSSVTTPQPPAPVAAAPAALAPQPAPAAPAAPPAPPKIVQPSSDADFLRNPKPPYPPLSRQLGEQGTVRVRVFVNTDGSAQKTEIDRSSGFNRLDQAALNAALRWRYVPGTRNGVAEASWVIVQMPFVLE